MSAIEDRYNFLLSDLAQLNRLIDMTPESAVIDRKSLEYRRSQVQAELDGFPVPPHWPASAHLSFNGKPVADKDGIQADFAGKAVGAFSALVTSLAANLQGPLSERGPIPDQDAYKLVITGVAHGSFGFDIEEAPRSQSSLPDYDSPVELAIEQTRSILESLGQDDESLADQIGDTDTRALDDMRDFLRLLVKEEAVCALSFNNRTFRFLDVGDVRAGIDKLGEENIEEGTEGLEGSFQGFLPTSRRAELVVGPDEDVISCKVDRTVNDPDSINKILGEKVQVTAHYRQVGGSRRRYTVLGFERVSGTPVSYTRA